MEDSFRVRVDNIFGSLGRDAPSSAAISPSLWRLTDEEVERRQWNRNKEVEGEGDDDTIECGGPSDTRDQLESDLQDLSDSEQEEEEEEEAEGFGGDKKKWPSAGGSGTILDESWDVQSNIGRDCTLDYEEEEDEFDKVAVGAEGTGDRIYMKDVKCASGIDEVNTYGELPTSFRSVMRDLRADHAAAKIRLKEDAEASPNFGNLHLSDNSVTKSVGAEDVEKGESDGDNPKPILKKRENLVDSRSQKRVRFSFDTKSGSDSEGQLSSKASDVAPEPCSRNDTAAPEQVSDFSQFSSGVPDYVRNPSKYTCYRLDSTDGDMDEQANRKAYLDFLQYVGKGDASDSSQDDIAIDDLTSVTFTLKKKPESDTNMKSIECNTSNNKDNLKNMGWDIAVEDDEVSRMEEDGPNLEIDEVGGLQKPDRQARRYRSRTNTLVDDNEEKFPT